MDTIILHAYTKKSRNDYIWAGYIIDITVIKQAEVQLQHAATHDFLTGLFNRQQLLTLLEKEYQKAIRYSHPLVLLMIDLDHFKMINDEYGHLTGDKILIECSSQLQSEIRELDVAGRFGGEEFLVILPETSINEATEVAERIRAGIENLTLNYAQKEIKLTVSIGLSSLNKSSKSPVKVIECADQALYKAKSAGRNCVKVFK